MRWRSEVAHSAEFLEQKLQDSSGQKHEQIRRNESSNCPCGGKQEQWASSSKCKQAGAWRRVGYLQRMQQQDSISRCSAFGRGVARQET